MLLKINIIARLLIAEITTPTPEKVIMALNLKKRNFKLSSVATGALVVGAGLVFIKTFPHLKASISSFVFGTRHADGDDDENKPIEVNESNQTTIQADSTLVLLLGESAMEITEWSDDNLKSFLVEVRPTI